MNKSRMTPVHRRRLRNLVAKLKRVPKAEFDLDTWVSSPHVHHNYSMFLKNMGVKRQESSFKLNGRVLHQCGTTCCAIGFGATLPSWQKEGFRFEFNGSHLIPKYRGKDREDAVSAFLGLTDGQTEFLFLPYEYPTHMRKSPEAVIRRIQWVLRNPDKEPGTY